MCYDKVTETTTTIGDDEKKNFLFFYTNSSLSAAQPRPRITLTSSSVCLSGTSAAFVKCSSCLQRNLLAACEIKFALFVAFSLSPCFAPSAPLDQARPGRGLPDWSAVPNIDQRARRVTRLSHDYVAARQLTTVRSLVRLGDVQREQKQQQAAAATTTTKVQSDW